ncbi:DUF47 family protein [Candidatus Micrarchaeota archaeon]|nr:DUF47 family protein [Candidatus Micrarchaeota archaeon]
MPLSKIKNFLVPQESAFFDLMQKQAETAELAAHALSDLLSDYKNMHERVKKIRELEHKGDQLMRDIYTDLNKTFIVPIDHGDISTLAGALDDVIDLVDHAATLMVAYEIETPSPEMVHLTSILVAQTQELKSAVVAINHQKTYGNVSNHCKNIKNLENKADEFYINAIAGLFKKKEPLEVMKNKEILDCLESAIDKVDKASQYISDIVMKHA